MNPRFLTQSFELILNMKLNPETIAGLIAGAVLILYLVISHGYCLKITFGRNRVELAPPTPPTSPTAHNAPHARQDFES